jgi:large subunit ribosomal protein L6
MSRIGRQPIDIPNGVTVSIKVIDGGNNPGTLVEVKGSKAALSQVMHPSIKIEREDGRILVTRPDDEKENRSLHGLTRTLINNMVVGVTEGFKKELDIFGVGYGAQKQGRTLTLRLGFSHHVIIEEPDGINIEVPQSTQPNTAKLIIHGADKQQVGQLAAEIRKLRPPEPYLGKGIRYANERIRRKAGKAGK